MEYYKNTTKYIKISSKLKKKYLKKYIQKSICQIHTFPKNLVWVCFSFNSTNTQLLEITKRISNPSRFACFSLIIFLQYPWNSWYKKNKLVKCLFFSSVLISIALWIHRKRFGRCVLREREWKCWSWWNWKTNINIPTKIPNRRELRHPRILALIREEELGHKFPGEPAVKCWRTNELGWRDSQTIRPFNDVGWNQQDPWKG